MGALHYKVGGLTPWLGNIIRVSSDGGNYLENLYLTYLTRRKRLLRYSNNGNVSKDKRDGGVFVADGWMLGNVLVQSSEKMIG